jgi:hypothetical protein
MGKGIKSQTPLQLGRGIAQLVGGVAVSEFMEGYGQEDSWYPKDDLFETWHWANLPSIHFIVA